MRVLVEEVPQSRSVSVGVWVKVGGRDDPESLPGLSHLIEHLMFKGTPTRDAKAISREIDGLGGQINGATGKEATFYYAEVPADGFPIALGVLADLVQHPSFLPEELDRERGVVLEEIRSRDDDPEQCAYDLFTSGLWRNAHPLARSVLGETKTISDVTRDEIVSFHADSYRPEAMVLIACGAVQANEVMHLAAEMFEGFPAVAAALHDRRAPVLASGRNSHVRSTGQTHLYLGFPAPDVRDEDRIPYDVVNVIFGGGTSSRLFRLVREERGLAYEVSSSVIHYSDAGVWLTYAGIAPHNVDETVGIVLDQLANLLKRGVEESEVDLARAKLRGGLTLDLEANVNRMGRLGSAAITGRKILSPDQLIARIDSVTAGTAMDAIERFVDLNRMNMAVIGPEAQIEVLEAVG